MHLEKFTQKNLEKFQKMLAQKNFVLQKILTQENLDLEKFRKILTLIF